MCWEDQRARPFRPISEPLKRRDIRNPNPGMTRRGFMGMGAAWLLGSPLLTPLPFDPELLPEDDDLSLEPADGEVLPSPPPMSRNWTKASFPEGANQVFLTFDDGPLQFTSSILDWLASKKQKATFFVIGRNLTNRRFRALAVRALHEGHELASHSYSHPHFSDLSASMVEREIVKSRKMIKDVVVEAGVDPNRHDLFFRYPFGDQGSWSNYLTAQEILGELGYRIAWWDLDTHDWRMGLSYHPRKASKVIASLKTVRPGDVVLLHDRRRTAKLLPSLLEVLESKKLVSIPLSNYDSIANVNKNGKNPKKPAERPSGGDAG